MLEQQRDVNVVALHREMLKKKHQLQQQPLYVALSGDPNGSIVLRGFVDVILEAALGDPHRITCHRSSYESRSSSHQMVHRKIRS